jgi:hypothetical protein
MTESLRKNPVILIKTHDRVFLTKKVTGPMLNQVPRHPSTASQHTYNSAAHDIFVWEWQGSARLKQAIQYMVA